MDCGQGGGVEDAAAVGDSDGAVVVDVAGDCRNVEAGGSPQAGVWQLLLAGAGYRDAEVGVAPLLLLRPARTWPGTGGSPCSAQSAGSAGLQQ